MMTYSGSIRKLPAASYASGGGGRLTASTMHLRRRRHGLNLVLRQRLESLLRLRLRLRLGVTLELGLGRRPGLGLGLLRRTSSSCSSS